jgi:SAM-dependent methyltransferase
LIESLTPGIKEQSIADIGCGPGNLVGFLNSNMKFPLEYSGYDIRKDSILYARDKYRGYNVKFSYDDWKLCEDNEFDVCIGAGLLGHRVSDNDTVNRDNDFDILRRLSIIANKLVIVTLPRADFNSGSSMPLVRYSLVQVAWMLQQLNGLAFKYILDGNTFDHEYILVINKQRV